MVTVCQENGDASSKASRLRLEPLDLPAPYLRPARLLRFGFCNLNGLFPVIDNCNDFFFLFLCSFPTSL